MYKEVNQMISLSFVIFSGNISDVVGKRGRILGVIISILNINFNKLAMYLLRLYNGEPQTTTANIEFSLGRIGLLQIFDNNIIYYQ